MTEYWFASHSPSRFIENMSNNELISQKYDLNQQKNVGSKKTVKDSSTIENLNLNL